MQDTTLHEVRCPNTGWNKNNKHFRCNSMCGRVSGPSMGEFWCRKCKVTFKFIMNQDGEATFIDFEPGTKPKSMTETAEDRLFDLLNSQN